MPRLKTKYGTKEFRQKLSDVLRAVEKHRKVVLITKYGKVVAIVRPPK